jgi:hypothetical protein
VGAGASGAVSPLLAEEYAVTAAEKASVRKRVGPGAAL